MNKYAHMSTWRQSRGCIAKRVFTTAAEARAGALKYKRRKYYKCEFCDGFHLTNSGGGMEVRPVVEEAACPGLRTGQEGREYA